MFFYRCSRFVCNQISLPTCSASRVYKLGPILQREASRTFIRTLPTHELTRRPRHTRGSVITGEKSVTSGYLKSLSNERGRYRESPAASIRLMTVSDNADRACMSFRATARQNRRSRGAVSGRFPDTSTTGVGKTKKIITKQQVAELLFETCTGCRKMAAIPQGAFAVCKVRRNLERNTVITPINETEKAGKEVMFNMRPSQEGRELTPMKYNSKLMNSIWGLYNRYSVHNFKKNTDGNEGVFGSFVAVWGTVFENHSPAANTVAAAAATETNS